MDDFELFNKLLEPKPSIPELIPDCDCPGGSTLLEIKGETVCTTCGLLIFEIYEMETYSETTHPRQEKIYRLVLPHYLTQRERDGITSRYLKIVAGTQFRGRFRKAIISYVMFKYFEGVYDLKYIIGSLMKL